MRRGAVISAGVMVSFLSGCEAFDLFNTAPPVEVPVVEAPKPPSEASLAAAQYYGRVEQGHVTRGLLRGDGGGVDTPFDADDLAREFLTIAFQKEFSATGAGLVRRAAPSKLLRWESPVRVEAVFGASVSNEQRTTDRDSVRRFVGRLGRATGHPVSFVSGGGNFQVLFLNEDERRMIGPELRRLIPGIDERVVRTVARLDKETFCVVLTSDAEDDGVVTQAVAVIRAELPPLLRLSCIHEELAQGMGLPNDSDTARPSIFNDDDEFGRLTAMDEMMLGMLYSPRLTPGMDAETARDAVTRLASGLMGEAS